MRLSELKTGEKGVIVKCWDTEVSVSESWKWDLSRGKPLRCC